MRERKRKKWDQIINEKQKHYSLSNRLSFVVLVVVFVSLMQSWVAAAIFSVIYFGPVMFLYRRRLVADTNTYLKCKTVVCILKSLLFARIRDFTSIHMPNRHCLYIMCKCICATRLFAFWPQKRWLWMLWGWQLNKEIVNSINKIPIKTFQRKTDS